MIQREEVIRAARRYVGTPFVMAGRSRRGIDCVGLPLCIARDLRVSRWRDLWQDVECHAYPTIREIGFLRGKLDRFVEHGFLRRIDKNDCAPGDMTLCFTGFGHDHHVAILTSAGLIEARNVPEARFPRGRVVENAVTATKWRSVIQGYQFGEVV